MVDTITYADGRTISYEYDPEERITKVTDSVEGITEYTYDPLGQLTSEKKNGVTTTVTYDTYSNHGGILTKGGKTYSYSNANKDLLVSYNGETISYGTGIYPSPNPVVYRGWNLTWTKGRQLASASGSGKTISLSYNPKGTRISKTVNDVKHNYVLVEEKLVQDEYSGIDYLYDNEEKVCGMIYNENAYYFYKNLQGDVIAITDSTGTVIARYSYDAWGVCTITGLTSLGTTVANLNLFRYRSYIYDADLGWYYLQSRYYDPEIGRFINADEPGFLCANEKNIVSFNLCAYCENDPVNGIDPSGYSKSKKATSLYTSDLNISNTQLVQEIRNTFIPKFINFLRIPVSNSKDFQYAWEDSRKSEIVVIETHGSPNSLSTKSGTTLYRTNHLPGNKFNLYARVVLLLGCNAGHYDHRYNNVAYAIAQKVPFGIVVASDGTSVAQMKNNRAMRHVSNDEYPWGKFRQPTYFFHEGVYYHGLRPTNEGWLIYKRTWGEPIKTGEKEFTTCGLFNFLAQRKFYNGWEERWKDQSAYY